MNACTAEILPATDGVPAQFCDAPCKGDYCKDHEYLDMYGLDTFGVDEYLDYAGDSDAEYDREIDRELGM